MKVGHNARNGDIYTVEKAWTDSTMEYLNVTVDLIPVAKRITTNYQKNVTRISSGYPRYHFRISLGYPIGRIS